MGKTDADVVPLMMTMGYFLLDADSATAGLRVKGVSLANGEKPSQVVLELDPGAPNDLTEVPAEVQNLTFERFWELVNNRHNGGSGFEIYSGPSGY
jgi:hypothetical protein